MLQTTVVMKTDWVKSTLLIRSLSAPEYSQLLTNHSQLIRPLVDKHHGRVIKGEGDSFWLSFPSVTLAAQAAIEMQDELRKSQSGKSDTERLAMRISIAIGDLLHRDGDVFGAAMSLAARMDGITPGDEIYLAHAAWQVLNHAEIETAFVAEYAIKGFDHQERLYRVIQKVNIQVHHEEVVVSSDLGRFSRFCLTYDKDALAQVLTTYEGISIDSCKTFGGRLRTMAGDNYLMTFLTVLDAMQAVEDFTRRWLRFMRQYQYDLPLRSAVHQGEFYIFRAHMFGEHINNTVWLNRMGGKIAPPKDAESVIVSPKVYQTLIGTAYESRFQRFEVDEADMHPNLKAVISSHAYRLLGVDSEG